VLTRRWLLKQASYTLHRPVRKRFLRNPYSVTNMDVCECDLIDIQNFIKYNDKCRYLLSVTDVFSKFLHVPLRAKTGTAVASVFRSILAQYSHRRPI
jgi:restriction endonuclease